MKKIKLLSYIFLFMVPVLWVACKQNANVAEDTPQADQKELQVPIFEDDSAFIYIEKQVSFGPRSPNSEGHAACKDWLVSKLNEFGATVSTQDFSARTYTGISFPATNIIGSYNPDHPKRVLLAAHWDTRFIAEQDTNVDLQDEPIPGADDGASGVGVLLEIARLLNQHPIDIGVDIIFFDAEDQGERGASDVSSWCLGAQYWTKNPHTNQKHEYGILLDMVGGRNARFAKEEVSQAYQPNHAAKVRNLYNDVWQLAQAMGKGNYFADNTINIGIDDHYFINSVAGIPMIDIINKPPASTTSFVPYWHTHEDDISIIDKRTLRAAGQVVLAVIYREDAGLF